MATGSCHCKAVTFGIDAVPDEAIECNCSHCRRKGYLLAFAPLAAFRITGGDEASLATYTFNTHNIRHRFCPVCGCAPFGRGRDPQGVETVAVNLRCLDDFDPARFRIVPFDGASL